MGPTPRNKRFIGFNQKVQEGKIRFVRAEDLFFGRHDDDSDDWLYYL